MMWQRILVVSLCLVLSAEAYRSYYNKRWKPKRPMCDPVKCDEHCVEVKDDKGCPVCECKPLCSEPVCEKPCRLFKPEAMICPICYCPSIKEDKKNDMDKPLCSPPKCPPGCEIEKFFDGPCPGCACKEELKDIIPDKKICEPVKCLPGCVEILDGPDGCPKCECKPICDPPKCGAKCKLDYSGKCPKCVCEEIKEDVGFEEEKMEEEKKKCDPVKCLPGCKEVPNGLDGCLICECKPICDPPKCDVGCKLDYSGKCPKCMCKDIEEEEEDFESDEKETEDELKKKCPIPEKCVEPECMMKEDEMGCPICVCKPKCDPPKCPKRCEIKEIEGKCPECVCGYRKFRWRKN